MGREGFARWHGGFTLVETILVVMILAIGSVAVIRMQGNLFSQQTNVSTLQTRMQLQVECAEQVMAVRRYRENGYDAIDNPTFTTNTCGGITALSGSTVASVSTSDYTGAACPVSGNCKRVDITQDGLPAVTLILVDY
jgi:prepilin-type N-terminal cleavage/methylation domain-containing protein